jgi:uncharacterized protein
VISIPFKLFRIQQIDSQIDQAQSRCNEINKKLSTNDDLVEAKQKVDEAQQFLDNALSNLSHIEIDVQQQRIKIETSEASLYGGRIQSPKELQEIQKEIAALKRYLTVLEDRQLEAMIAVDDARDVLDNTQNAYQSTKSDFNHLSQVLSAETKGLLEDINHLTHEKEAATTDLPDNVLNLYETLRKQRRGVAVSRVNNNSCTACGATINASLLQAASLPGQIARCETCGRILYAG